MGYEEVERINAKIIYVFVTGCGQTGSYSHLERHNLNYIDGYESYFEKIHWIENSTF
ncbi:MAG: hypothetical protein H7339_11315 [Arcicella sp.]|nr:hypothetical protein [Arcicella sp.]